MSLLFHYGVTLTHLCTHWPLPLCCTDSLIAWPAPLASFGQRMVRSNRVEIHCLNEIT